MKPGVEPDNWNQHWGEYSIASDYSPAVSYRRRVIRRLLRIDPKTPGYRLVELGCGTGQFATDFCPRFPLVTFLGVDISEEGVQQARRKVPGARFEVCNLIHQPIADAAPSFEATHALCSEVLEHVDDPVRLLRNSTAAMARGCRLVVTVPGGPMNAFDRHIGHRRHFKPSDLKSLLAEAGFETEEAMGMGFPFYNLYRLALLSRGQGLVHMVSGQPSALIKASYRAFDALGYLNLSTWGWQTVAVARWSGG